MDWSKELTDACEMTTSILHESKVRDQTVCISAVRSMISKSKLREI